MKIGILTLHSGANYGGTLQCYALYRILESLGHTVTVINYIPKSVAPFYKRLLLTLSCCRSIGDFKTILSRLRSNSNISLKVDRQLIKIFDQFRLSNLHQTEVVDETSIKKIVTDFDAVVIGSDQVWGSFVREKLVYFGDFGVNFSGKLISYAACSPNIKYPIIRKSKLSKLLHNFSSISVRDMTTKKLVKNISGIDAQVVFDPTQVYDFKQEVNHISHTNEPYILVYVLGSELSQGNEEAINIIKSNFSTNIKVVAVDIYGRNVSYANQTLHQINPLEWINLIRNAEIVFSDSFHASVFATKFRVPIIAYYSETNRASRLLEFFCTCGLDKYLVNDLTGIGDAIESIHDEYSNFKELDFKSSYEYLKDSLR